MSYTELIDSDNNYIYYIFNNKVYVPVSIFTQLIKPKSFCKHWINHYDIIDSDIKEVSHQSDFTLIEEVTAYLLAYTKVNERFFIELITSVNKTCRVFKNQNELTKESDLNLGLNAICYQIQCINLEARLIEDKISKLIEVNE